MRDRLLRIATDSDPRRRFKLAFRELRPAECRWRIRQRSLRSLRSRASNGARSALPRFIARPNRPRTAKWTLRRLQIRASPRAAFIYLEALEIVST
jgi:hypothetical protein